MACTSPFAIVVTLSVTCFIPDLSTCIFFRFRTLVIATGIGKANIPKFPGVNYTENYETISTNPDNYEGQTVLIIGE